MTKKSRDRRKERRAKSARVKNWIKKSTYSEPSRWLEKYKAMEDVYKTIGDPMIVPLHLIKVSKEEILAIRNPAYEYLIP